MGNIVEKEFEWGKILHFRAIATILGTAALSIGPLISESSIFGSDEPGLIDKIFEWGFAAGAILSFVQYMYIIKNKTYIRVTNDGIKKTALYADFDFSSDEVEWKDISRIERNPGGITLICNREDDIKIRFSYLNKNDRENLIQIINEHIEHNKLLKKNQ
jgi:hypothetical protein